MISVPGPVVGLASEIASPSFFPLQQRWITDLSAPPAAPPAFDAGLAFIPLRDETLVAIELIQGTVLWTSDYRSHVSPAAGDGVVVVDTGQVVVGLRATDAALLWVNDFGAPVSSPLVFEHGWLVVGLDNGEMIVLRGSDGAEIWRARLSGPLDVGPSVAGAHLFVPVGDGGIVAFDLATGRRLWETRLGGSPQSILALDRLFVGATDNLMYCLSLADGTVIWRWRTGADVVGRPTVDEELVFFVSLDNVLRALDRSNGAQRWRQPLPGRPTAGPQRVGDIVLVSGIAADVLAFDTVDGTPHGMLTAPSELAAPARILRPPSALAPGVVLTMGDGRMTILREAVGPGRFSLTFPPPPLLARPDMLAPRDVLPFFAIDETSDSTDPERPGPRLTPPADVLPFVPLDPDAVSPAEETDDAAPRDAGEEIDDASPEAGQTDAAFLGTGVQAASSSPRTPR